jgi:hypothetical protein
VKLPSSAIFTKERKVSMGIFLFIALSLCSAY